MLTTISNSIVVEDPSDEIISWCEQNLVLDNPLYLQLAKRQQFDMIRRKHVPEKMGFMVRKGNTIEIPFGCLYAVWPFIKKDFIETHFAAERENAIKGLPTPQELELRDYQEEAVSALIKAKGGVLKAGCGAGKTITGIELVHRIGQRFLWLVHTHDLLDQAKRDFLELYPNMDIGLITEGRFEIGRDGAIATVQTLSKMDPKLYAEEFNIVIVDEVHHAADRIDRVLMYKKVLGNMCPRYRYGLTATPYRQDGLTNTMYFNIGCNPDGSFSPTFAVARSRIKTLDAQVISLPVDTELVESYKATMVEKAEWPFVADDNGTCDLSSVPGTPTALEYSCFNQKAGRYTSASRAFFSIKDRKKTRDGILYSSSTCTISGLTPGQKYKVVYEYQEEKDMALFESDGTIEFATLVSYLTHCVDRNISIVDYVCRLINDEGRKVSILSQSVEHCSTLAKMLEEKGIKARCVTGKTKKSERKDALENTDDWDVIVATIQLFKEGIDIKSLDTVIITTPMKDEAAIEQACGRCERYMAGKTQPLFVYVLDKNFKYCYGAFAKIKKVIRGRL
jgi:superfamily II DNA or RNA helicase